MWLYYVVQETVVQNPALTFAEEVERQRLNEKRAKTRKNQAEYRKRQKELITSLKQVLHA